VGRRNPEIGLTIIYGPMFSGKSKKLIEELDDLTEHGQQKVQVFRPAPDKRTAAGKIASQNKYGASFPAYEVGSAQEILKLVEPDTQIVAIDEVQFFDDGIVEVCLELMRKMQVFVAGIPTNFRRKPYGSMPQILAIATKTVQLMAVCDVCHKRNATHTQRWVNSKPPHDDDPEFLLGGPKDYRARCLRHHVVLPARNSKNGRKKDA